MKPKNFIISVLALFALFIFSKGALAASKSTDTFKASRVLPLDGGQPSQTYSSPSPLMYEGTKADCGLGTPTGPAPVTIIQQDQWASTFYDYQKNGSMGRMIAVDQSGHRGMVMHETRGPYSASYPRWITYNCKDALDSWLFGSVGYQINGGTSVNAGYTNIALMHDGREVVIYHTTGEDQNWGIRMTVGDQSHVCSQANIFAAKYDLPDNLGRDRYVYWPKMGIVYDAYLDTDYVHVVMTEYTYPAIDNGRLGYIRCHLLRDNDPGTSDTLLCEAPTGQPGVSSPIKVPPNMHLEPNPPVAYFGEVEASGVPPGQYPNTISVIVATSPVSRKVAVVFTNKRQSGTIQVNNDVFYFESTNNGNEWFPQYGGQWPPTIANGMLHNITNYPTDVTERAYMDVAACYDYNDSLHIVWTAAWIDSVAGQTSNDANLYHWSKTTGISMIASGYWGGTNPGKLNRNISKMSISAMDPIYHPGGNPDSIYLFVTWTQFNGDNRGDTLDNSVGDMTNGDIYASVSANGGQTWTPSYNLTNTQTPGCTPGNCLSEHWSSLAENMYNGDLHIEYVCDKDAGGANWNEGQYTDNPMMYMHVYQLSWVEGCGLFYTDLNPPSFTIPPIKVSPTGTRTFSVKLKGIYNKGGDYTVTSDNAKVTIDVSPTGHLEPNEERIVSGYIHCSGQELIKANISITGCIGQADQHTETIPLYAVCSNDYYECMRYAGTMYGRKNDVCSLWVSANTEERLFDLRLPRDTNDQVISSAGVVAATITPAYLGSETIVGRQDYRDTKTGARDTLNVYYVNEDAPGKCRIRRVCVDNTFIWYPPATLADNPKWYWFDVRKQAITFENKLGYTCDAWRKEKVFKQVWIKWNRSPAWWPSPGTYQGHGDIYYGVFADVDAPFDTGGNGYNWAGWDATNQIMWQKGWYHGQHPAFDNHYVGLAFTDKDGNAVAPYGAHDVLNREYLYPNGGWGWQDTQLYRLASTAGTSIDMTTPDSALDRSMVLTAGKINQSPIFPSPSDTLSVGTFILIEASDQNGLASLQTNISNARTTLIPILRNKGLLGRCGDTNCDGNVNGADVSFLINYLFVGGPKPCWPIDRADVNWDHKIAGNDASYLINYLFVGGPKPRCPGLEY